MATMALGEDGRYNLTSNPGRDIPSHLKGVLCSNIYVEFLQLPVVRLNKPLVKNHAVLKIDFADLLDIGDRPCAGVRIDMAINWDLGSSSSGGGARILRPGELQVKPVSYRGPSRGSACTCELAIGIGELKLDDVLVLLRLNGLLYFSYVNVGNSYLGCRDFVTQVLWLLHRANYILSEHIISVTQEFADLETNIYSALGKKYSADGRLDLSSIDFGYFEYYERTIRPDMRYDLLTN